MARSRGTLITIALVVGLVLVLIAVFRSCRQGSVPPAERDGIDETSYLVWNPDVRDASRDPAAADAIQLRAFV